MSLLGWIVLIAVVVLVLAVVGYVLERRKRTGQLRSRFGPEYDRVAADAESKRAAEAELADRAERRDALDIRPLSQASHDRYVDDWQNVQARFVDDPRTAVVEADSLVRTVMAERGYPVDKDFQRRAADISVDHPEVVERYREGHRLSQLPADDDSATENLRAAMTHYRALFEQLVESEPEHAHA